jgi:anthranilate phosphoribosyltransferase
MDEVSPYAPTRVTELSGGKLTELVVAPEDFGLAPLPEGAARGSDIPSNAQALLSILSGEPHPARDAFVLNAAAALTVALELPPKKAADLARETLESGAAARTLDAWKAAASRHRPKVEGAA